MDRINGAGTVDIGAGRRGFRDENLETGTEGTEVTAAFMNMVQEELLKVIEAAGFIADDADWTQLNQALARIAGQKGAWVSVLSMTLSSAPGAPTLGDTYLIPVGATGTWLGKDLQVARWTGIAWSYTATQDGHGISLPDGRIFERIASVYVEKVALDAQSGKWTYAAAAGTANVLTVTLAPVPASQASLVGSTIRVKTGAAANTGAMTLNVNNLGAKPIVRVDGKAMAAGDVPAGAMLTLIYDGTSYQTGDYLVAGTKIAAPAPPAATTVVLDLLATSGLFEMMVGHLASAAGGTVQCGIDLSFDGGSTWTVLYQDNNVSPGENAIVLLSVSGTTYRALIVQTNSTAVLRAAGSTGTVTALKARARSASGNVTYSELWIRKAG